MIIIFWTLIFCFYCLHTYINYRNNVDHGNWFWFAVFFTMIPVFPLMCKYSKNLLMDGLIFDLMMLLSYVATLLVLGAGKSFNGVQWAGLAITVVGFILMKARI